MIKRQTLPLRLPTFISDLTPAGAGYVEETLHFQHGPQMLSPAVNNGDRIRLNAAGVFAPDLGLRQIVLGSERHPKARVQLVRGVVQQRGLVRAKRHTLFLLADAQEHAEEVSQI